MAYRAEETGITLTINHQITEGFAITWSSLQLSSHRHIKFLRCDYAIVCDSEQMKRPLSNGNGTTIIFDWAIDLQAGEWSFFTFLFAENYVYWQLSARIFMWLMCNAMVREERRKCFKLNDFNDRLAVHTWVHVMKWSLHFRSASLGQVCNHFSSIYCIGFFRMTMSTGRKMCWIITHTLQFMSCTRLMCTDETA